MKIECPHCHLTGEVSDLEIPAEGRHMDCPRCHSSFTVKRRARTWSPDAMNTCPSCSFSTFSEETFDVCPQCGLVGKEYNDRLRKRREAEQLQRDAQRLQQKFAPPVPPPPAASRSKAAAPDPDRPALPQPVLLVGGAALAAALLLLLYGLWGVTTHSAADIRARMVEETVEPDSLLKIFTVQILPYWFWLVFGGGASYVSYRFLQLDAAAPALLDRTARVGLGLVVLSRLADYAVTVAGAATPLYYVTELLSTALQTAVMAAPLVLLIWGLRRPATLDSFPRRQSA